MNAIYICLLLLVIPLNIHAIDSHVPLLFENENVLISFKTNSNKVMTIAMAYDESYIVYRYGTQERIELEYPNEKEDSWNRFKYVYYMRGGGAQNEGLDLKYLIFQNGGYTYTIYEEYSAVSDSTGYGIRIEKDKNKSEIKIDPKNVIGTMGRLRDYERIEKEEW